MRILHCPTNTGSGPFMLSRAQRQLGHMSDLLVYDTPFHTTKGLPDINFHIGDYPRILRPPARLLNSLAFIPRMVFNYDVIHYHSRPLLPATFLDARIVRFFPDKVIHFHFTGCDVRGPRKGCPHCDKQSAREHDDKKKKIDLAVRLANAITVCDPTLIEEVPSAEFIPWGVDLSEWQIPKDFERTNRREVIVLHAPSDPFIKGTRHVKAAVRVLRKEGYPVRLKLVENLARDQVKAFYLDADVVVDNVGHTCFGSFAVEAMLLGKPVLSGVREDVYEYYLGCPIISVDSENLINNLRGLVEDEGLREKLGKKSRRYALQTHDIRTMAKKLEKLYHRPYRK